MRIGIVGAGHIGATLARKLAGSGHEVKLANSKGPDSLGDLARDLGAVAASKEQAVRDVDAVILSIPFARYPDLAGLLSDVPAEVVVIDTSNYYPSATARSPRSMTASPRASGSANGSAAQSSRRGTRCWPPPCPTEESRQARRDPSPSLSPATTQRKATAFQLVDATGFDALDAGPLAGSWRQQPGTPGYCTELTLNDLQAALVAADKRGAPEHREALIKEFMAAGAKLSHDEMVARNRAITA
jgi:predicted dinucleotide-binding enzyme